MIETDTVTKRYGNLLAVDRLSFSVGPGEVLGFLGPNGAGKTTTMKMITGFIAPTSGHIRVCGHDVAREPLQCKRLVGYLPEGAPSYGEMTPADFLAFVADLRGLAGQHRRRRLDEVIDRLDLGPVMGQTIDTLSKGYRRRVGLAQAVLHDPRVLILDEPTDGLDPNQKHQVRELIRSMASDKIIIISTHILEEVEAVCSRALIISRGRLLADDTPDGLAARSPAHNAVHLALDSAGQAARLGAELEGQPAVLRVQAGEGPGALTVFARPGDSVLAAVQQRLAHHGWVPADLRVERGRLDSVFRDITGELRQ